MTLFYGIRFVKNEIKRINYHYKPEIVGTNLKLYLENRAKLRAWSLLLGDFSLANVTSDHFLTALSK